MKKGIRIGLIGDHDSAVIAHQAIPIALNLAGNDLSTRVEFEWVSTDQIQNESQVSSFDGLWCVPASPYRSMDGALLAIRYARENARPFLGTCGGFQHAIIEYARNFAGWEDAEHAESSPNSDRAVISTLSCTLVEVSDKVYFQPDSRIASIYGRRNSKEGYHCNYGLNMDFAATLIAGPLRATAHDKTGEVRAVELRGHPFFIATLFQPERAALEGFVPPLVRALVLASSK